VGDMAELSEGDKYLLEQIRRGDGEGWTALVERYQGRLLAFARGRLRQPADAEDIVQDTFFHFLKGLPAFREDASVETYLFTILRRKLVDHFRGKHMRLCSLQEVLDSGGGSGGSSSGGDDTREAASRIAGDDPTPSFYARRDEQAGLDRAALAAALRALLDRLKEAGNLRDLRVIECLFYGQLRNKDVAKIAGIDEKHVALIKHRALNEVREHVARNSATGSSSLPVYGDSMVTEVWEEQRLTCPKRSTIGRYLLGTLDPPWQELVDFHLNRLGCRFCRANLDDLQKKTDEDSAVVRDRILHSTIGFFRKG
jgi:RNA polymerase sigma factor (sigma-70 family)